MPTGARADMKLVGSGRFESGGFFGLRAVFLPPFHPDLFLFSVTRKRCSGLTRLSHPFFHSTFNPPTFIHVHAGPRPRDPCMECPRPPCMERQRRAPRQPGATPRENGPQFLPSPCRAAHRMKLQTFFEKSDPFANAPDAVADRAAVPRWVGARALLRVGGRLDACCSPSSP